MTERKWKVQSKSRKEVTHTVTMITPYHWECTCEYNRMRHQTCNHIKGVQKAYDKKNKQTTQSKPTPNRSQTTTVPSDNRGHGQERDSVQSGELRRSSSVNGDTTRVPAGSESAGQGGRSDSSSSPETSVGTPSTKSMVPGPAEGSYQTETQRDKEIRERDAERKRQQRQYEKWLLRETQHSKELHKRLRELEKKMSENPEKAWIYDAQIAPIKTGIRKMNQRDWQAKPPFKTNLLNLEPAKKH